MPSRKDIPIFYSSNWQSLEADTLLELDNTRLKVAAQFGTKDPLRYLSGWHYECALERRVLADFLGKFNVFSADELQQYCET